MGKATHSLVALKIAPRARSLTLHPIFYPGTMTTVLPSVKCKTCETGQMVRKKTHRMSGPAVVVGYLFLVPSALGVLFGLIMMFASGGATAAAADSARERVEADLRKAGVSDSVIADVLAQREVDTKELPTYDQQFAVSTAEASLSGAKVGAGAAGVIGFGFAIFMIVGSFIGGLIGYLLTMKKQILQCGSCQAVVQAS